MLSLSVLCHSLCMLGREHQHPLAAWLREDAQGLGQILLLSGGPGDPWLGLVDGSNPVIKSDDVPSLCVRPPSLELFCFLPEPHKPISTDFCKRSQILAFAQISI